MEECREMEKEQSMILVYEGSKGGGEQRFSENEVRCCREDLSMGTALSPFQTHPRGNDVKGEWR